MSSSLAGKNILLILTGGIAVYKSLDLIRRLKEQGAEVKPIMTSGAQEFITPLAVSAVSGGHVHTELFDREDEVDVGHIRLAREANLVLVAPATADFMAKAANGIANDLASTCLLAAKVPVVMAPAMNPAMWSHSATQRNVEQLKADGVSFIGPESGEMAESGEAGLGRMSEPTEIVAQITQMCAPKKRPLTGKKIVLTAGPTHEPIDPVRYIANRSSGKQGYAIASALRTLGADVTLVSGPTNLADLEGVKMVRVQTALEMQNQVHLALPADAAIFVAAVADWRVEDAAQNKIKKDKSEDGTPIAPLKLVENPDILATVGNGNGVVRPALVVGFAAETTDLFDNAIAKLERKGADVIVANNVAPETGVMGGDFNKAHIVTKDGVESWSRMNKNEVAHKLAQLIAEKLITPTIEC